MEHDDEWHMASFAYGGRRKPSAARPPTAAAHVAEEPSQRFVPQGQLARDNRGAVAAVKVLKQKHSDMREMVLSGLAAAEQAAQRSVSADAPTTTARDTRIVDAAASSPSAVSKPLPSLSVDDAYNRASKLEARYRSSLRGAVTDTDTDADGAPAVPPSADAVQTAWQALFTAAQAQLARRPPPPAEEAHRCIRAQMTALSRQAGVMEVRPDATAFIRARIRALEACVDLSRKLPSDPALLRGTLALLRTLAHTHAAVGAVDAAHRAVAMGKEVEDALKKAMGIAAPEPAQPAQTSSHSHTHTDAPTDAAPPSAPAAAPAPSISSPSIAPDVPAPPAPAMDATDTDPAAASSAPASPPHPEPSPAPAQPVFQFPTFAEGDRSDNAVLGRALQSCMFGGVSTDPFSPLLALLNKSLLGDAKVSAILTSSLQPIGLTAAMVAAATDRADVLRRLLVLVPRSEMQRHILELQDVTGRNACHYAVANNCVRSLDELLRALTSAGLTMPADTLEAVASALRVPLEQVSGSRPDVRAQLEEFGRDPATYVRTFRAPLPGLQ